MIFGLYEKRGEVDTWPSFLSFKVLLMMMPFNCSYRNKNEPSTIYPSLGYSPCKASLNS
jgi:hypothetical protein